MQELDVDSPKDATQFEVGVNDHNADERIRAQAYVAQRKFPEIRRDPQKHFEYKIAHVLATV